MQPTQQQTTLAARQGTPLSSFSLERLDEALKWAAELAKATVLPAVFREKPGNVLAAIMLGQELDVPPFLVMREVFFISDRPSFRTEFKVSLVRRRADCEYFHCIETTSVKATWASKRKGRPERTLTVELSQIPDSLKNKNTNWKDYPANMLRWRCAGWLAEMEWTEVLLGIGSLEEEQDRVIDAEVVPSAEGRYVPSGVSAPIPREQPAAAVVDSRPAPASDEMPPHNPETGEVVEANPPGGGDPVEVLLAALTALKPGPDAAKQLEQLRDQVDVVAPKGHARRAEIARLINAKRAELQGAR